MSKNKPIKNDRRITTQYGSRKGLVKTLWHQGLYRINKYRQYENIDWQSVRRLVFICKGNICRSAFAEELARSVGVEAISFGVETKGGSPANADAMGMAKKFDLDLSGHKTSNLESVALRETDLIIAMEPWQLDVVRIRINKKCQLTLLGLWEKPVLPHIQDPYGYSTEYFNKCFSYIQRCVQAVTEKLQEIER